MTKYFIIIIFFILGCDSYNREAKDIKLQDTIYSTNFETDPNYKKLIIKIRSDSNMTIPFALKPDTINYFRIAIPIYPKYPIYIKNLINLEIKQSNPYRGEFQVIPMDSLVQFDVYIDFGKDNAIIKYEDSTGYKYKPHDGLRPVGRIREIVTK